MEGLRILDEVEIKFPGKNVYSWNLFERVTNDVFTQQSHPVIHQAHLAPPERLPPECDTTRPIHCHENPLQPQIIPE